MASGEAPSVLAPWQWVVMALCFAAWLLARLKPGMLGYAVIDWALGNGWRFTS